MGMVLHSVASVASGAALGKMPPVPGVLLAFPYLCCVSHKFLLDFMLHTSDKCKYMTKTSAIVSR